MRPNSLFLIAIIMAFCSIIYELAIAKTVSLLTGNVVLWESLTISVYIAGLGIGAYIYAKSENSQKEQYLLKAEIILAITASFSIVGIFVLHVLYRVYFYGFDFGVSRSFSIFNSTLIFGFLAQIMTLLVAVPSGIELPALLDMVNRSTKKDSSNRLLAFFYFGTLVGTFWFAWAWLPYVDIPYAVVFTVSLNVCLCLWLMKEFQQFKPISIAVMMSVIVFCFVVTPVIYQIQLKNFYSGRLQKITQTNDGLILFNTPTLLQRIEMLRQQPTVERIKTHAQMIDVVTKQSSKKSEKVVSIKQPYRVHMNGHFQFSSLNEADYHEHMVHVPLALHETLPCHVLVLGAGDGLLIRELLKHDEICDITLVEYDQGILDFAINDKRLSELNKNSLQSSKVKIVVNDAFMYLRQTKSMYDAIYIDFPYPFSYDLARLYSIEFSYLVKRRLNKAGFIVVDVPFKLQESNEANMIVFNTLYYAGFRQITAFQSSGESFISAELTPIKRQFIPQEDKFRSGRRATQFSFNQKVLDIPLRYLRPDYFSSPWIQKLNYQPNRLLVNSILQPRILHLTDPLF